jgi:hypothetical protein
MAVFAVLSFCVLAFCPDVSAMWEEDGNLIVTGASESFWFPKSCSDGDGGSIIVWQDFTGGIYILHGQRIDPYGHRLWPPSGIQLNSLATGDQIFQRVISDGEGGAIVVWVNDFYGAADIYAQRFDGDGTLLWGANGLAVCTVTGQKYEPDLVSDGTGGAIFTWADGRGADIDIYVQRVSAAGMVLWTADGKPMTSAAGTQENPRITSDNNGGAIVAWEDNRGADQDIYVRQVSAYGTVNWLGDGLPVCVFSEWQDEPVISSDGAGGAIIAWRDQRAMPYSIYAQRVDRNQTARWNTNGNIINDPLFFAGQHTIMPDGHGGVFAAWIEKLGSTYFMTAQRMSAEGDTLWGTGGRKIHAMDWNFDKPVLVPDDADGVIVVWSDDRVGNQNVYAQRLNNAGDDYWQDGGKVLSAAFDDQGGVSAATDGDGGAIACYHDNRTGVQELFAQRITVEGKWGYPCPDIYSVKDVPGDEGGQVNIAWYASRLDNTSEPMVVHYSIWRAIEESAAMFAMNSEDILPVDAMEITLETKPGAVRTGELLGEPYFWELIGTIGSSFIETYAAVMPTLFDSTASSPDNHYFQVMAHTEDPLTFWISEPDSAYSVDNLAPCAPLALAGEQSFAPEGLELTWAPNGEPDLDCYRIYRGTDPGFDPGAGNLLVQQCDTLLLDEGWDWTSVCWYKVAAVDIHGNESEYAVFGPDMVTGDDPMPVPAATFLDQNYPNPFNPNTTIAFGLKTGGFVNLSVYNAAGQLVAELINESRPAGQYATVWNGKARNGISSASGVYFYKLVTEEFAKTRKMILLR